MEPTEFVRYRVLMERPGRLPVVGAGFNRYPLWGVFRGTEIEVGLWAEFEGDVLRARFGTKWPDVLASELGKAFLRIVGEDDQGRRFDLSPSRRAAASDQTPAARRLGSGMGTLVRHLVEVERITRYEDVLLLLERSDLPWVQEWLGELGLEAQNRSTQRRRLSKAAFQAEKSHAIACPYCRDGLPPSLQVLIKSLLRPE